MNNKNANTPPSIDDLIKDTDKSPSLDDFTLDNIGNIGELTSLGDNNNHNKAETNINLDDFDFDFDKLNQELDNKKSAKDNNTAVNNTKVIDNIEEFLDLQEKTKKTPATANRTPPKPLIPSSDPTDILEASVVKPEDIVAKNLEEERKAELAAVRKEAQTNQPSDKQDLDDKPTPVVAAKPAKKSLFGNKKPKAPKAQKPTKAPTNNKKGGDSKQLKIIIFGGLLVLLLLIVVGFFMVGNQTPSEPVASEQPTVSEPVADVGETPTETESPDSIEAPTTDELATENTAETNEFSDISDMMTVPEDINTAEILQADIPEDPALIKEEIDRLADIESRLSQQAQDLNKSLSELEQLTKDKEEHIALLEAQIALMEAERNSQ